MYFLSAEGILRDKKWLDNLLWYSKVYVKKIIEKKTFLGHIKMWKSIKFAFCLFQAISYE